MRLKLKESSPLFRLGEALTCVAGYYDEHTIDIDDAEEDKNSRTAAS